MKCKVHTKNLPYILQRKSSYKINKSDWKCWRCWTVYDDHSVQPAPLPVHWRQHTSSYSCRCSSGQYSLQRWPWTLVDEGHRHFNPINHRHFIFIKGLYTDIDTFIFSDRGVYTDINSMLHLDIDIDWLLKVSMSTKSQHFLDIDTYITI